MSGLTIKITDKARDYSPPESPQAGSTKSMAFGSLATKKASVVELEKKSKDDWAAWEKEHPDQAKRIQEEAAKADAAAQWLFRKGHIAVAQMEQAKGYLQKHYGKWQLDPVKGLLPASIIDEVVIMCD